MNGSTFEELMKSAFRPFLSQLGFTMQPVHVNGSYYQASFTGSIHTLVVSFEPGDEQTTVMLLANGNDDLSSIDDPAKTPRLSHLNTQYMSTVTAQERAENETYFSDLKPYDSSERGLIKCAKDLRLVLPRHLAM